MKKSQILSSLIFAVTLVFLISLPCVAQAKGTVQQKRTVTAKYRSQFIIEHTAPVNNVSIGQAVPVNITVRAKADLTDVTFELNTDKGLDMTSAAPSAQRGALAKNSSFTETITVVPSADGVLYINVIVNGLTTTGKKTFAAVSIPVSVGTNQRKALKGSGTVRTDSTGKKVISMPAQEK